MCLLRFNLEFLMEIGARAIIKFAGHLQIAEIVQIQFYL